MIVVSKYEEDEEWLEPPDMLVYYVGALSPKEYTRQLVRMEREILYKIQWKFTK